MGGLVLVCFGVSAFALDPNRLVSQYMRQQWGSEKGFPGGTVTAFAQTADGYLWIGTDRGLIRFDGLSFRQFQEASPLAFPVGPVQGLLADGEGNLWVLLQSTKILRYHEGKFELGREEAENGITAIGKRRDGTILFSSLALGALTYSAGKFVSLQTPPEHSKSTAEINDNLSSRLSWATGVVTHRFAEPESAVISLAETPDGRVWMGTLDKGLFYLSEGKVSSAGKELVNVRITSLLPVGKDQLWIGTDKGIYKWDGREITSAGVPEALRHAVVMAMIRDDDGNIWLGTKGGLFRANAEGVSTDKGTAQMDGGISALFEDREGNVWAGGTKGIQRLRDSAFVTYAVAGLQSESSGPVYVDEAGQTWFAPFEGGLHWLKGEHSGSIQKEGLASDVIYSIAGNKGELWIGRQQGGLTRLRFIDGLATAKTYTRSDGLAQNSVYAVHVSEDGTVWAGTLSEGLSEFRKGSFTSYTTANGLSSNTVTSIAGSPDETIWVGTPTGLNAFTKGQWRNFARRDGMPSDSVNCLFSDSSGTLWIGTTSGLAFFRSGHIETPIHAPASLQEQILGIVEDNNGWLWIATSSHVLRAKRELLMNDAVREMDVRYYGVEDGLHGVEGVKRQQSVVADHSGRIWFSMNRGLSVVDPARVPDSSAPAIVHVEGILAEGNPVGMQASVRLPGPRRRITFVYAGLSLSVPERVRFKYKLDGVDEGWSDPVSAREATYNNLESGTYRFRVVASNSDGLWNSAESAIQLQIAPAYWQTWWFRVSSLVAVALAILLFFRLRMRKLASEMNMRFEERLAERTRIAQELHDTLLQGVLSASMQLDVANDRLPETSPAKPLVGRVLELMTRVIDEGRNTVRGLRVPQAGRQNLEEAFSWIQQELALPAQSGFRILVEGEPRQLRPAIHDEIYFIGREALANALRHSGASRILVEIEYAVSHLRVLVRDNGQGIDEEVLSAGRDGHWGLSGMRERAERIGARLRLLSRAAAGTEVELLISGRIAYEHNTPGAPEHWYSRFRFRKEKEPKTKVVKEPQK